MQQPKYSQKEIERRWLVATPHLVDYENKPYRGIEDTYISETLLRLRKMTDPHGVATYKLCKKYGRDGSLANPITNIYLSEAEYLALSTLSGIRVCKKRYSVADGAVDIYPGPLRLAVFEIEFDSERAAAIYTPPAFVGEEVTDNPAYSGVALAARFSCTQRSDQ